MVHKLNIKPELSWSGSGFQFNFKREIKKGDWINFPEIIKHKGNALTSHVNFKVTKTYVTECFWAVDVDWSSKVCSFDKMPTSKELDNFIEKEV